MDFISSLNNIMEEMGVSVKTLFTSNIVSENTFYKYRKRLPSLKTLTQIANFLKVSIDYIFEYTDENQYSYYDMSKIKFYENLLNMLTSKNISGRKFCSDLHYSRDNIIRWRNGTNPSLQTLKEIAAYFGCTIDDLLR